jgi:hypothetical protein
MQVVRVCSACLVVLVYVPIDLQHSG